MKIKIKIKYVNENNKTINNNNKSRKPLSLTIPRSIISSLHFKVLYNRFISLYQVGLCFKAVQAIDVTRKNPNNPNNP